MKHKRTIFSWFYPFFGAATAFNIVRIITDLPVNKPFWYGDKQTHIAGLILTTIFFYIMDFIWRYRLNKVNKNRSIIKEYFCILAELYVLFTLFLLLCIVINVAAITSFVNYCVIVVTCIPLLLLYYTLIRNAIANEKYQEKIIQLEKVKADQAETELKFLKSQYHPHFLFNALNTIYFQIDEENKEAKHSVEKLSDLLRYQLYDIEKEVTMEQEINYLKSYIAFQQLRMSERLVLDMYFDPELKEQKIHPLLFQPLIENAFKYVRGNYKIKLELRLVEGQIRFVIENSISHSRTTRKENDKGIGIENLKRRLDLLYPNRYDLEIKQTESVFVVKLVISTD